MFIAHLSLQGFKHATAKSYISAISYYCKIYYKADPTKSFLVQKLAQGMKRSIPWTDSRLPITFGILSIIVPKLQIICNSTYAAVLFKADFTLAFHALLRVGKFALSKGYTSDRILHIGDVSSSNEQIVLRIRHSNTDQLGFGTSVVIKASTGPTCPVQSTYKFCWAIILSFFGHYNYSVPI